MEEILKDVNAVIGVHGSFVCDEEGALIFSAMPDAYGEEVLSTVGHALTQTISGLSLARRRKVWDVDLVYRPVRILAKNTGNGCLCILGSPDMNIPLLNLTADLTVKKIKQLFKEGEIIKAEDKPPDLPQAAQAVIGFVERLFQEIEGHGISRTDLFKIVNHRLKKLNKAYPFLDSISTSGDKLDASGVAYDALEAKQLGEGLASLVHGICFSLRGMMGEQEAESIYLSVYEPYLKENTASFAMLELEDTLRNIAHEDLPSAHAGVDIRLD